MGSQTTRAVVQDRDYYGMIQPGESLRNCQMKVAL